MTRSLFTRLRLIGHSPVELAIRNATLNDPWGPTGLQLNDLAKLTYTPQHLQTLVAMLTKRLSPQLKHWRGVLKLLTVVQFCLQAGLDAFVEWVTRAEHQVVEPLQRYRVSDFNGQEQGHTIRSKARQISRLVLTPARLAEVRVDFHRFRSELANPGVLNQRNSMTGPAGRGLVEPVEDVVVSDLFLRNAQSFDVIRRSQDNLFEDTFAGGVMAKESGDYPVRRFLDPLVEESELQRMYRSRSSSMATNVTKTASREAESLPKAVPSAMKLVVPTAAPPAMKLVVPKTAMPARRTNPFV